MALTRGGFSALLAPGLRKIIFDAYDEQSLVHPKVFNMQTSKRKYEDDQQITGFTTFAEKDEGKSVAYEEAYQGWTKRYTHTTYGLGFRVTEELYEDDQYGVIKKMAGQLGFSANATIETLAAAVFNNGFADTGPDGESLFDTAHVLKNSTSTSANRPSTDADLTVASYEAAYIAFRQQLNESGLKIQATPAILLCSLSDEATALKIVGSPNQAFTADNQINPYKGKVQVISWPYLSDSDAWFLLAAPSQTEINFFSRVKPAMQSGDDFDTGDAKFKMRFRCSMGWSDWRKTYGTSGG